MKVLVLLPVRVTLPTATIDSLLSQEGVDVDLIVVSATRGPFPTGSGVMQGRVPYRLEYVPVDPGLTQGVRVATSLNTVLGRLPASALAGYDYIMKSDDDLTFPTDFLRVNTEAGYDLMGPGHAMLMKMDSFLQATEGRFVPVTFEDIALTKAFQASGFRVLEFDWVLRATNVATSTLHADQPLRQGEEYYRVGYPLGPAVYHALRMSGATHDAICLWILLGYLLAWVRGPARFPFSEKVRAYERTRLRSSFAARLRHPVGHGLGRNR